MPFRAISIGPPAAGTDLRLLVLGFFSTPVPLATGPLKKVRVDEFRLRSASGLNRMQYASFGFRNPVVVVTLPGWFTTQSGLFRLSVNENASSAGGAGVCCSGDFVMTAGSEPLMEVALRDENGDPIDLTGATLQLRVWSQKTRALAFTGSLTPDPDQVTNKGVATYQFASTNLISSGTFEGKIKVTKSSKVVYFPASGVITIAVDSVV